MLIRCYYCTISNFNCFEIVLLWSWTGSLNHIQKGRLQTFFQPKTLILVKVGRFLEPYKSFVWKPTKNPEKWVVCKDFFPVVHSILPCIQMRGPRLQQVREPECQIANSYDGISTNGFLGRLHTDDHIIKQNFNKFNFLMQVETNHTDMFGAWFKWYCALWLTNSVNFVPRRSSAWSSACKV